MFRSPASQAALYRPFANAFEGAFANPFASATSGTSANPLFPPFPNWFGAGFGSGFGNGFGMPDGRGRGLPDMGLKSFGAASRTAWSLGIEWYDYARQAQELAVTAAGRLASARSAGAAFTVQTTYLRQSGELAAARMPVLMDLSLTLLNDLARGPFTRQG